jgi:hypothetical protein
MERGSTSAAALARYRQAHTSDRGENAVTPLLESHGNQIRNLVAAHNKITNDTKPCGSSEKNQRVRTKDSNSKITQIHKKLTT